MMCVLVLEQRADALRTEKLSGRMEWVELRQTSKR